MTGSEKQLMQPGMRSSAHDWANLHHFIVTVDTFREVVFFLILMPIVLDRILMMKMMTWDREIARCRICFPMLVSMIRHMQSDDVACPDCVHRWIRGGGGGEFLLRCFSTNKTGSMDACEGQETHPQRAVEVETVHGLMDVYAILRKATATWMAFASWGGVTQPFRA